MSKTILPSALIDCSSRGPSEDAGAMSLVEFEFSFIRIAILVNQITLAVHLALFPVSFVDLFIRPGEDSIPVVEILLQVAEVGRPIREHKRA